VEAVATRAWDDYPIVMLVKLHATLLYNTVAVLLHGVSKPIIGTSVNCPVTSMTLSAPELESAWLIVLRTCLPGLNRGTRSAELNTSSAVVATINAATTNPMQYKEGNKRIFYKRE